MTGLYFKQLTALNIRCSGLSAQVPANNSRSKMMPNKQLLTFGS
ncbi:hypothetical protein MCEGEM3_00011 [Oxalobacteraceae bacterium]